MSSPQLQPSEIRTKRRMLDLFCGRWGWSKAFAARGWECVGVDLVEPPEVPAGCKFVQYDILNLQFSRNPLPHFTSVGFEPNPLWETTQFDFICASSPCEQFSVHGLPFTRKTAQYPELGIRLFNHTRQLCEAAGVPYVMENVRAAQDFVGNATNHCGPFYLWGSGVPSILPQGIRKGMRLGKSGFTGEAQREWRRKHDPTWNPSKSKARQEATALVATIPPELSSCVASYAERLIEQRQEALV